MAPVAAVLLRADRRLELVQQVRVQPQLFLVPLIQAGLR